MEGIPLSGSVKGAIERLGDENVESAAVINSLLKSHPEYGGGLARDLELESTGNRRKPIGWVNLVREWLEEREVVANRLHGKLLIAAMAELDQALGDQLRKRGFLRAVLNELDLRVASPSQGGARSEAEGSERGSVQILDDNPTRQDLLRRRPFARYLADTIRRVRADLEDDHEDTSFLLHIDGRWGSGKTTMLGYLREALEKPSDAKESPWVVIDFNAWRYQRLEPPWWGLRQEVVTQGFRALWRRHQYWRWLRAWLGEWWWRIWTTVKPGIITSILFAVLIGAILGVLARTDALGLISGAGEGLDEPGDWAALIGISGSVWGLALAARRRLSPASQRGARTFLESQGDPMRLLRRRFRSILKDIRDPVAIFVDDIDRCSHEFVVQLMEGVQTLFRGAKITYVIAGDRRWIEASFDKDYEELKDHVGEPGRPLGSLFLQKAFQVSLELPPITNVGSYWEQLLGGPGGEIATTDHAATAKSIEKELSTLTTPRAIEEKLDEVRSANPREYNLWVLEALRREADPDVQTATRHALQDFHPLLDRNPRAMKRFVNAYGIHRAAVWYTDALYGVDLDEPWKQLALWAIVQMRWPRLAEHLRGEPDLVRRIADGLPPKPEASGGSPDAAPDPMSEAVPDSVPEEAPDPLSEELRMLISDPRVRQVVLGEEVGVGLSATAVRAFYGFPPVGRPTPL